MNTTIRRALPAAAAAALVAGALAVPAIATTDDDSTTNAPSSSETDIVDGDEADSDRAGHHLLRHGALAGLEEGELAERLAAELGLHTETVQDAIDAVRSDLAGERLDTAVERGRLSQEEADRIEAAVADGTLDEVLPAIRLEQLEARLDERVAAGDLTQQEADEILAAAVDGDWPGRGRGGRSHHGPRGFGDDGGDADADATTGVEADTTSA